MTEAYAIDTLCKFEKVVEFFGNSFSTAIHGDIPVFITKSEGKSLLCLCDNIKFKEEINYE